ncbi:hypothetical protein AB0395_44460 [Streptosporangium sp. NPDC051023]|uniref:hypothetical protein n=1 Tax=Streptosporangium sp. NPDC051023 TaxID=3155410 RepID=UPI00344BD652
MDRRITAVASLLVGLLMLTACGGVQNAPAGQAVPSAPAEVAARTPAAEPNPNATESNPPGDIPDSTVFVAYRTPRYQIKVPEGWARTTLATGASFTDKLNSVRIETGPATSAPTVTTATRAEVPKLKAAGGNFVLREIETVTRAGGQAVRIVYLVDSAPNPVTGKVVRDEAERYEFHRDGHEAILTLSGPVGADNVDPWKLVSDSFRWA